MGNEPLRVGEIQTLLEKNPRLAEELEIGDLAEQIRQLGDNKGLIYAECYTARLMLMHAMKEGVPKDDRLKQLGWLFLWSVARADAPDEDKITDTRIVLNVLCGHGCSEEMARIAAAIPFLTALCGPSMAAAIATAQARAAAPTPGYCSEFADFYMPDATSIEELAFQAHRGFKQLTFDQVFEPRIPGAVDQRAGWLQTTLKLPSGMTDGESDAPSSQGDTGAGPRSRLAREAPAPRWSPPRTAQAPYGPSPRPPAPAGYSAAYSQMPSQEQDAWMQPPQGEFHCQPRAVHSLPGPPPPRRPDWDQPAERSQWAPDWSRSSPAAPVGLGTYGPQPGDSYEERSRRAGGWYDGQPPPPPPAQRQPQYPYLPAPPPPYGHGGPPPPLSEQARAQLLALLQALGPPA
jgi:hypothetical protein